MPSAARAQRAVFVVRHAEKASDSNDVSVPLSPAGAERARRLAAMLQDAGITAIYSTDTVRTRATAEPLARLRKLPVEIYAAKNARGEPTAEPLLAKLRAENNNDIVLVIGHGDTVPILLRGLGVAEPVAIGTGDYDNLFLVVPQPGSIPLFVRLRF
jgi:broad specificity phosphatase PhoE